MRSAGHPVGTERVDEADLAAGKDLLEQAPQHGRDREFFGWIVAGTALVLAGILVSMVAMFGRGQIDAYFDVSNRAQLADEADSALRRIVRDLQSALPNSVRQSGSFLEFVPIRDAGRYRVEVGVTNWGDGLYDSALAFDFRVGGLQIEELPARLPQQRLGVDQLGLKVRAGAGVQLGGFVG